MVTATDCINKYGQPELNTKWLTLWHVPKDLQVGAIPKKIYCNKDLVAPLSQALCFIKERGLSGMIHTWDGCFNIRPIRGGKSWSLHSWAIAVDINAFENGLGQEPRMKPELVQCFLDAGFDWGGYWKRKDGMHFQLAKI